MASQRSGLEAGDRRNAFRCNVQSAREEALLVVGRKQVPARLTDESAGGFAVVTEGRLDVQVGDVVRLRTDSGWFEVRVANLRAEPAAPTEATDETEVTESSLCLGLERQRELDQWDAPPVRRRWFDRLWVRSFPGLGTGSLLGGIVFAVVIAGGLVTGAMVLSRSDRLFTMPTIRGKHANTNNDAVSPRPKESARRGEEQGPQEPDTPSREPPAGVRSPLGSAPAATANDSAPGPSPAVKPSGSQANKAWGAMIRSLAGADPFLLKEVVEELGLTEEQQEQIRRIAESSAEALRQIRVRWPTDTRQQHAEKRHIVLTEARRRALEVLNEEQRARWQALDQDGAVSNSKQIDPADGSGP